MIATSRPAIAAPVPGSFAVTRPLRLGTRGSALAVAQSTTIAEALRAIGADVELVTVRTLGDDRPPDTTWGEGAFVGALETGLADGMIDLAVHSAKDVPTTDHPRLTIAAYPLRADPRDAVVGREAGATLASLPEGARVGTDSPRRTAFLRAIRPDLRLHPLHGNVDTRLRRLDEGATDALVLAVAGLTRLGHADRIGEILPAELCPPAPGWRSSTIRQPAPRSRPSANSSVRPAVAAAPRSGPWRRSMGTTSSSAAPPPERRTRRSPRARLPRSPAARSAAWSTTASRSPRAWRCASPPSWRPGPGPATDSAGCS
jgi:hypothetical protein